jgi:hypothetical protein
MAIIINEFDLNQFGKSIAERRVEDAVFTPLNAEKQ